MRGRSYGVLVVAGAVLMSPACESGGSSNRGSETHWLTTCDSDDVCGASLRCICGACTLPCTQSSDCMRLGAAATCAPPSVVELLCPGSEHTSSLCLSSCDIAGGCGDAGACIDGVCSPRPLPKSDSGAPPVPDGGKSSPTMDGGGPGEPPDATANVDASPDAEAGIGGLHREAGGALSDTSAPADAASESGSAECQPGHHVVSTGDCKPILFSDDFENGTLPGDWSLWRRAFVKTGGRIQVEDGPPQASFNYGAAGNGRGGTIATHIDDTTWTDYRLDFDAELLQAGSYNPYGLSTCTRRLDMYFRVEQETASWNQPETAYAIGVQTKTCDQDVQGTVSLGTFNGYYCPGIGWGCSTAGESRGLDTLVTSAIVDGANHYTIEIVGKRIQLWVNGAHVFDYTDDVVPYPSGTSPVTHGGISFTWVWELLGWADNVVVTDMR